MIEVLKQALAHAKLNERHQTVAESYYWLRQYKLLAEKAIAELESQKALTHPPQRSWVGLTQKEVQKIHDTYHKRMGPQEFASMIEAKLKQKNGFAEEKNT